MAFIVFTIPLQEAYAVVATISSSTVASPTTVVITFSVAVDWVIGDFTDLNVASEARTVSSIAETAPSTVVTITFSGGSAVGTDATGDIDIAAISDGGSGNTFAGATNQALADIQAPIVSSAATSSSTTIVLTMSETMVENANNPTDFVVSGVASSPTVGSFVTSGTSITLTLTGGAIVNTDTITLAYTGTAGDDLEDAATAGTDLADFSGQSVTNNVAGVAGQGSSSGCRGDCSAPTLGIDDKFTRVVENGFTYNGNTINVERYFTPYPLITVEVGKQNKAVFKIYENSGPDNIQHFEFAFGLDVGQVMGTSNAMIAWDRSHDGTETVTLVDPHNALENVRVSTSEGKCKAESTTNDCLIITVSHTFRESLDFDIVGTNVWDNRQHAWQNFYNHGIHIEGESLNPPDEYVGYCHNILCSSIKGNLIHLIETGKNTAVDEQGNTWTFDNTWIQDYVSKGKIDDPMTSQGYDRDHVKFNAIKQEQEQIASFLFEKYYKTSALSQEPAFSEINDIKFYEYPDTIDKKFDPVLQAKMHQEDIRAQKYLEEMFAKMYPGKVFD